MLGNPPCSKPWPQVRYLPGKSCRELGLSCTKLAIKGKGPNCRGDFLEVLAGGERRRWEEWGYLGPGTAGGGCLLCGPPLA